MTKSFDSIKKQLSLQHYYMNDAWLKNCLDYFLSEHPNEDQAKILSLIIHQWLLSDLREINNQRGYLPKNIQQQKCITLPGKYILQIEKAYDISTSKYKQLEKIRNISNENIEITDAEKSQPTDLNKGKRVMNLYLSDGIQDVIGMEYKPIPSLGQIVSGYKVMIKGPVVCRRGVILLEEKNIFMIGGEIESLSIVNATENVFARALNLPENPDPHMCITKTEDDVQCLSDDNMDIDLEAVENIEKLNQTMFNLSATDSTKNQSNKLPMTSSNKQDSAMLNELPVCFEQQSLNSSELVDDTDDEWIGQIDENNLDVVAASSVHDTNQELQEFASDLEFCEFEMDDITDYDNNPVCKNENKTKPLSIQTSTANTSNSTSNKIVTKAAINNPSTTAISKNHTPIKNPLPSRKPPPVPSPKKITNKQQSLKSVTMNSKITDFLIKPNVKNNKLPSSSNNYDSICNIKKFIPTNKITYKTIKATTKTLQKLTKKDCNWHLEGSVTDGVDSIDVTFSSEVLEKLIGFSFNEFSQRKKCQKTNPKIKDELRQTLRKTETALIEMNSLLKLELLPNESKAKIICITPLPEEEKLQW